MAKLAFLPYSPTCMGSLGVFFFLPCWRMWQNVFPIIFAKFAEFTNFYGSPDCFVVRIVDGCGKIVILVAFPKLASFANLYGTPHCSVPCPLGKWGTIFFPAVFAKFATFANLYWLLVVLLLVLLANVTTLAFLPCSPNHVPPFADLCRTPYCLVLCLVGKIFSSRYGTPIALCFVLLASVAKLFSCYTLHPSQLVWAPSLFCALPCLRMWQIVFLTIFAKFARFADPYGPPDCLVLCLVGECGKTVVFVIFVKFANIFFIFAIFVVACISGHVSQSTHRTTSLPLAL